MQSNIMFVPGQQIRTFNVYRKASSTDAKNRLRYSGGPEPVGFFKGTICQSNQREIERFKSLGHPITHTITATLRQSIKAEDILKRDGGMEYFVQGVDDPMGAGLVTIIYCKEEAGVHA